MRISEAINKLNELKDLYGDIECYSYEDIDNSCEISPIEHIGISRNHDWTSSGFICIIE